ncbi:Indoleamine 2,3-dioxygenase [Smittium culicis]|uniref:Indoleamine 2,3-dioxygenase n=2 Tax=Smittium culicis TaxID=133412 RepID=A0A1R1XWJ2_9FUNG|nr:Indoleamine 2,3-dioxygenase [Smittium culicis]
MVSNWDFMPAPLSEYDISTHNGFLSPEPPLKIISDPYYKPWEDLVSKIVQYQLSGGFREMIHNLPTLSTDKLVGIKEYQRAYVVLGFLSHGYVWSLHKEPKEELPKCISIPFCEVSEYLGINPVSTNASVVLWNWEVLNSPKSINDKTVKDVDDQELDLDNLATLFTFTGSPDESWFYLVSVAIESKGGKIVKTAGDIANAILSDDLSSVVSGLEDITKTIQLMTKLLVRMNEKCDPYIFYWKIRPYLAGWENMESVGLHNGVHYDGTKYIETKDAYGSLQDATTSKFIPVFSSKSEDGKNKPSSRRSSISGYDGTYYRKYAGGSAAQSSIIQLIDIILGIRHYPSEDEIAENLEAGLDNSKSEKTPPGNPYLMKMRNYMPGLHRKFLQDYASAVKLRQYILRSTPDIVKRNLLDESEFSETINIVDTQSNGGQADDIKSRGKYNLAQQTELIKIYNRSISSLKTFRDAHISIVTRYVAEPARGNKMPPQKGENNTQEKVSNSTNSSLQDKVNGGISNIINYVTGKSTENKPQAKNGIKSNGNANEQGKISNVYEHGLAKIIDEDAVVLGTGGTDAIEFLKNIRDETFSSRIDS